MTITTLLQRLPAALDAVEASLPTSAGLYPHGPRLRFLVRPPKGWIALPPLLDPVGVLWYAETGDFRGLLDGPRTAIALGLSAEDGFTLLHASDVAVGGGAGPVGVVRELLIAVVEGWRSQSPPAPAMPKPREMRWGRGWKG